MTTAKRDPATFPAIHAERKKMLQERALKPRKHGSKPLPVIVSPMTYETYKPPVSEPPRAGSLAYKDVPSVMFGKRT